MLYRMTSSDLKYVVGGNGNYRCGRLIKNVFDGLRVGLVLTCGAGMVYGLMRNQGNLGNAVNVNIGNNINVRDNVIKFGKLFTLSAACYFLSSTMLDVIEISYLRCEDANWLPDFGDMALGEAQDL